MKVPVKSSPPANQHSAFNWPNALPVAQPTAWKHQMNSNYITVTIVQDYMHKIQLSCFVQPASCSQDYSRLGRKEHLWEQLRNTSWNRRGRKFFPGHCPSSCQTHSIKIATTQTWIYAEKKRREWNNYDRVCSAPLFPQFRRRPSVQPRLVREWPHASQFHSPAEHTGAM